MQGGLSENQLTLIETDEKNIELDSTGQSGSDINNHANKYKLSGEGLFFSNNGGQTWNVGVTPKGINADYIKVGSLDASKISIVDGEYLYFLWDKGGITAYRTPQVTIGENYFQDFARFNKYGLSLVEDGNIKLRAGYQYRGSGKISEEEEISGDTPLGFYLYNSEGREIFSTQAGKDAEETARIQLSGEIFVTDSSTSETISHGNIVEFSGQHNLKQSIAYKLNEKTSAIGLETIFNSFNTAYQRMIRYVVESNNWEKEWASIYPNGVTINGEHYSFVTANKNKIASKQLLLDDKNNLYNGVYEHYSIYITFTKDGESQSSEGGWSSYKRGKTTAENLWRVVSDQSQNIYIQNSYKANKKVEIKNVTVNSTKITYYSQNNGVFTKNSDKTLYFPNNSSVLYGYDSHKILQLPGTDSTGAGEIGLYINNKETADGEISEEVIIDEEKTMLVERLFCCAKK